MVTAPVSKAAISATGADFSGHTEFLATLTGAAGFVMTFVNGESRVALATTHLSLADVPAAITSDLLLREARDALGRSRVVAGRALPEDSRYRAQSARGRGREVRRRGRARHRAGDRAGACDAGIDATGPYPADSIFVGHGDRGSGGPGSAYDAILAMYHDQGTIAAKLMGFGRCVNLTLGLPIVRTSVDHGTAFEIAGRGAVDHGSMAAAVRLAGAIAVPGGVNRLDGRSEGRIES